MYGQGSYAPQYRQGPPPTAPPPMYQQAPPGQPLPPPPPQYQQAPPGQQPPVYQHGPLPPPPAPPAQTGMGHPFMHPPQPVHRSGPVVHASYGQPGGSYPPQPMQMPSHNAHHVPQPMPPRMLPPPPPPPSQGQVMYRTPTPHLPPPGIQHVMPPPPPPPSSFISITPASFASFAPPGDAHLPPLPCSPPPLPPSPPPPLPPPPPPPALPAAELPGIVPEEQLAAAVDNVDAPVVPACSTEGRDGYTQRETGNAEESAHHIPSPPPKPAEEVVRNIETLCKFISKVGPTFETFARTKEAGNPHYAFLFGGTPGSAEAIGHDYFLWMKNNYQLVMKLQKDSQHNAPVTKPTEKEGSSQPMDLGDENAPASPAISDMDMEDDISLDGDRGFDDLSKPSTREPISGSNKMNVVNEPLPEPQCSMKQPKSVLAVSEVGNVRKISTGEVISGSNMYVVNEPLHAPDSTMEQLDSVVAVSRAISYSGSLPFPQDAEGDKDSPLIEDASLAEALPDSAECLLKYNVHGSEVTPSRESNLVKGLPTAVGGKLEEIPRIFIKDRGPFQSIQGYASDDSDEYNKKENAEDIIADRVSPKADSNIEAENASLSEIGEFQTSSDQAITAMVPKEAEYYTDSSQEKSTTLNIIFSSQFDPSDDKKLDDTIGPSELSQSSKIVEDGINYFDQVGKFSHVGGSKDTAMPDVDEFGRLVRKGSSDSDSDGMHYPERSGKRRSWSRSQSPQGSKWRRRSRSPRRRGKQSRSPRSPGPSRSNAFARRDRDQPPECFNFIRGRCFRGASCRYRHNDFGRHKIRQQQYQEYPQDSQNDDAHAVVSVSVDSCMEKETGVDECNNITEKEANSPEKQAYKVLSEATIKTINGGEKLVSGSVVEVAEPPLYEDGEIKVANQVSKDVISDMHEPQVEEAVNATDGRPTEEEKFQLLPDPGQILPADSLPVQLSADKTQGLPSETCVQSNSGEGTSSQTSQSSSVSASIPEQPQNVTQNADTENPMFCPTIEVLQPATSQNQKLESKPFSSHAPASAVYPNQSPITQPFSSYALTYQPSDQSLLPKEFPQPCLSTPGSNFQTSQLLPPPPPLHAHPPPLYTSDNTGHQSQRPISHAFPSHGHPIINDYNQQKFPSNLEWPNLPPPPPSHTNALPSRPSFPHPESHFPQFQHALLPRTDFNLPMRPNQPGELPRSQVANFRPFRSVEPSHQHPMHLDEFRQMPLSVSNQQEQPFVRDGRFPHPQMPGPQIISDPRRDYHLRHQPFLREDVRTLLPGPGPAHSDVMHPQSKPFQREPFPNRPYSIPEDNLPPRFLPREQFPNAHDFSHQPPYGQQHPANSNVPLNLSTSGMVGTSITRYPSSFQESNLPPHLPYTGLPKPLISAHYNPFASTFEQTPTSYKSGPSVPRQENDMNINNRYESSVNPGHVPVGGPGSRITVSPPNSRISSEQFMLRTGVLPPEAAAEVLPNVQKQTESDLAAGDAYDPLFDSIEPSNAFKKVDLAEENTDVLNLDVDENSRQKEETTTEPRLEADELGEAATDAEVGVVENGSPLQADGKDWSPGIPADVGNIATAEIEIDQVRSPGKSKKNKEGRSMKLFKIALADFVKEVLKPSWRQGNLSKEAFKTIVKKTVEKVSGAMPSHQIPKSQVKINQFVESSQRKLTKLVMGYVDKYVKA